MSWLGKKYCVKLTRRLQRRDIGSAGLMRPDTEPPSRPHHAHFMCQRPSGHHCSALVFVYRITRTRRSRLAASTPGTWFLRRNSSTTSAPAPTDTWWRGQLSRNLPPTPGWRVAQTCPPTSQTVMYLMRRCGRTSQPLAEWAYPPGKWPVSAIIRTLPGAYLSFLLLYHNRCDGRLM